MDSVYIYEKIGCKKDKMGTAAKEWMNKIKKMAAGQ